MYQGFPGIVKNLQFSKKNKKMDCKVWPLPGIMDTNDEEATVKFEHPSTPSVEVLGQGIKWLALFRGCPICGEPSILPSPETPEITANHRHWRHLNWEAFAVVIYCICCICCASQQIFLPFCTWGGLCHPQLPFSLTGPQNNGVEYHPWSWGHRGGVPHRPFLSKGKKED